VAKEKPESELRRLRTEQGKTRRDEVFGGLSRAERAEYDKKAERIRRLEGEIQESAIAEKSLHTARVKPTRKWKGKSETDSPHAEPRQPYRSREKDSADASRDSTKKRRKRKNESDEKGSE
jgi:hypothetical protein